MRATLKCLKPNDIPQNPKSLGEHLLARRLTLGLLQRDVALLLGVDVFTLLNWENSKTQPAIRAYPAIRAFLGHDPFPVPSTTSERLKGWRMGRGLSVKGAARLLGVDEATWAGWERGQIPIRRHQGLIDRLFG